MTRHTLLPVAVAVLVASAAFAADVRWLNVDVNEPHDQTTVQLHLPLSLVMTVLGSIDTHQIHEGRLELATDHARVDWMAILKEIRTAPEGEYVKVKQPDADVNVSKRDGMVFVHVSERGEGGDNVDVRVPMALLDAFQVDKEGRVDLKALVSHLDAVKSGELVRVESSDAHVRVWVE
jgi:hypothetical protein